MVRVERENWRVYVPSPIRFAVSLVAVALVYLAFFAVDLADPRVP